jgi:hypothetical protein
MDPPELFEFFGGLPMLSGATADARFKRPFLVFCIDISDARPAS